MAHTSTAVLESQPDWLTATISGARNVDSVLARVRTLMRSERVAGNRELPFSLGEYVGTRCGRVRAGTNYDRALVQLSGDLAALHLDWILPRSHHITRLDLAVTVQTPVYTSDVASTAYADAVVHRITHPRSASASLVQNADGGATLYIGKRTADRYFRCYNKQAECIASGDDDATARYARAWRYELELHDDAASNVAHALPAGPARPFWIEAYIAKYCADHGVTPRYAPLSEPVHVGGFRRRTDRESRLDWLSRSVQPTVRWLIDSTPRDELLRRLGLADTGRGQHVDADA